MDLSQLNSIATSAASGTSAATTVANALSSRRAVQATPKDTTTSGTTSSSSSSTTDGSADITSDDFLTLLVSELQNQDPTQPTDPNEYITQLAQVNSLQQLISINQGIGTLDSAISSPGTSSASGSGSDASANAVAAVASAAPSSQVVSGQNAIWGGSTGS
jgi:flagellar basal-body rod modification protein FlgD